MKGEKKGGKKRERRREKWNIIQGRRNRNRVVSRWKINIDYKYYISGYSRKERCVSELKAHDTNFLKIIWISHSAMAW